MTESTDTPVVAVTSPVECTCGAPLPDPGVFEAGQGVTVCIFCGRCLEWNDGKNVPDWTFAPGHLEPTERHVLVGQPWFSKQRPN